MSPLPTERPAAVLFDMDGTLVDTEPLHFEAQLRVMRAQGVTMAQEEFTRFIGWAEEPFWAVVIREHGLDGTPRELAGQRTRELLRLYETAEVPVLAGARELLEQLEGLGIPRAVASSCPREQIEATLEAANIARWIDACRSGHDDVENGKPAPDVYIAAAAALGVDPARCLAVEDSATGVASAKAAGCRVVAVPCPSHPDPNLGEADSILGSLVELGAALGPGT